MVTKTNNKIKNKNEIIILIIVIIITLRAWSNGDNTIYIQL